jgi:hypothetical protein
MEKYMTDDRSQRARAAAEAGTATRDTAIQAELDAWWHDKAEAAARMKITGTALTFHRIQEVRLLHQACDAHLDELARLIAQRDGCGDPRQGYLRELTEGDEPGVALNGWGSKR